MVVEVRRNANRSYLIAKSSYGEVGSRKEIIQKGYGGHSGKIDDQVAFIH